MAKAKADGYAFVYVKSTEGKSYVDPMFETNVKNANDVGLDIGAYHFARPDQDNAVDEANFFVTQIMKVNTTLMPVLDLEAPSSTSVMSGAKIVDWARTFINTVQAATGRRVMLYTGNWFIDRFHLSGLSDIPLWDSVYSSTPPSDDGGWTEWTMWQYTDRGHVDGINGNVDLDVAVSLNALKGDVSMGETKPVRKLILPKDATTWTVYHTDRPPIKADAKNVAGVLKPSKFGGLTYDIIRDGSEPNTYIIKTGDFGEVKIYATTGIGAKFETIEPPKPKPVEPPKPIVEPKPTPAPKPVEAPKPVDAPNPTPQPVQPVVKPEEPKPTQPSVTNITVHIDAPNLTNASDLAKKLADEIKKNVATKPVVNVSETDPKQSAEPVEVHVADVKPIAKQVAPVPAAPQQSTNVGSVPVAKASIFDLIVALLKKLFHIGG